MSLFVHGIDLDGTPVALRCDAGTIVALGPEVEAEPGDDHVDGRGGSVVPGLVNGHGHAAMTLLRGFGDDLPLMEWLQSRIWPAEARMTADDIYWGTRLACIEMVRSGTTRAWDMYWQSAAVAQAFVATGVRGAVSQVLLSGEAAPTDAQREHAADGLDRLAEFGPLVTPCLGPHAIYTVAPTDLRDVAELAAERNVPVHIHAAETRGEVEQCLAEHGVGVAAHLDACGLLGPRTVLAHGVWFDDAELALVAERGATIVTNPASNMKLAVGRAFPYVAARAAGVAIGLGTDGAASNNSLDLLADVKLLSLLQKHTNGDPSVLPAAEAWAIATGASAPALGGTPVAVGQPADFVIVDHDGIELVPAGLVDALVASAASAHVQTVVIDGRVVMRDRVIEGEDEVRARVHEAAVRVRQG
jgi:5-methylthioadenosine/S-adenosylhomocysteine deaminase